MTNNADVQHLIRFFDLKTENLIGYQISDGANGDSWQNIIVVFNGNTATKTVDLPKGNWTIVCKNGQINENGLGEFKGGTIDIAKHSALILKQ